MVGEIKGTNTVELILVHPVMVLLIPTAEKTKTEPMLEGWNCESQKLALYTNKKCCNFRSSSQTNKTKTSPYKNQEKEAWNVLSHVAEAKNLALLLCNTAAAYHFSFSGTLQWQKNNTTSGMLY